MTRLSKTEQKVLAYFGTKREENGRVQVWTLPERRAAYRLAQKGLVRAEHYCNQMIYHRSCVSSLCTLSESCVNVWKVQA